MHVHGVTDTLAATLGQVVLEDRREHRWLLAQVDCIGRQHARTVHQPGVAADARQCLLDAFECGDRHVELLTHLRVLASDQAGVLGSAGADGRQRDRTTHRQAVHQHHPALAQHRLTTYQVAQRDEHVLARVGAVHERRAQRQVTAADFHAGRLGRNQRQADAQIFFFAEQVLWVVGLESQTEQGRDRAEGDVAFFPGQAQADDFFTLPLAFADDPGVGHRTCIGTGQRAGQREAGNVFTACQTRQVMIALLVSAVMQQQFSRAEGVGHHHCGRQVAAAGGQLHGHLRVGVGREALATEFLGDDQREEAVRFHVRPGFRRQVHGLADFPVADHRAEFFGRPVDKGLFLFGQLDFRVGQQLVPVRATAEQLAIPPDRAGIDRITLGLRHRRQDFLKPAEHRRSEVLAAQIGQHYRYEHCQPEQPEHRQQPSWRVTENAHGQQVDSYHAKRRERGGSPMSQPGNADDQHNNPQQQHKYSSVMTSAVAAIKNWSPGSGGATSIVTLVDEEVAAASG